MAITNGYATLAEIKSFLSISDSVDDTLLENMVEAASRSIDRIANRRFYADTSASARSYRVNSPVVLYTDDISGTTGLLVKLDEDGDGTFETTLTIDTDFIMDPLTAAALGRPFTQVTIVSNTKSFPIFPGLFQNGLRPGVQVTAKWGWPSVPDDIAQACLILTADLYKRKDSPGGVLGLGDLGAIRMTPLGRDVTAMVRSHRKESVA
jgi:hypothetical protein